MRIKRVEIIGFKSFCDRAVIQIDQPITAVVGPNGCGKSNIVDAIRWCMGEQSAKHLRGKAMEDVIFAGSETRGPAPMAEVSLTFDDVGFSHETLAMAREGDEAAAEAAMATVDAVKVVGEGEGEGGEVKAEGEGDEVNAEAEAEGAVEEGGFDAAAIEQVVVYGEDGQPITSAVDEVKQLLEEQEPLDFTRYTEVTISRRLYRDGTSQYFINKVPCRLRDVTDFFLGTGVGTKAYSIIEQGRIGQIVSSRPQDRRLIIEEAAGITKFKSKKKAAERKLDQTKQNLLRVSDIVTELEKRMGTLRRQAQKAERYRAYKTELRDLDLWKASHRFLELRADDARVRGRWTEAADELVGVRALFDTKDAAVVTERAELAVEERRLSGVQEVIYELDNRVRLAESKIGWQTREADDLDGRATAAASEIETLDAERQAAAAQLAQQEAELAELVALVGQGDDEVARCEALAGEARQSLANAQSRLDEARNELSRARTDVATATAQTESLARRREDGERRLAKVSEELDQAIDRQKELEREARRTGDTLAQLKQTRLDLGAQTEGFAARRDVLAEQVHEGEAQVETLRTEAHRRRSRLVSLVEIQERYEGFARGTRVVMQQAGMIAKGADAGRIRGLVADVVRAPEMLELAVEAALGDRLGGVLVDDHDVGVAAIGYLKSQGAGRSAFVPLGDPADVMRAAAADADAESALERALDDSHMLAPDPEIADAASGAEPAAVTTDDVAGDDLAGAPSWVTAAADTAHGIVVEDHTAIHAAAATIGGEGVLGRLVDLVGFVDGYQAVGQSLFGDCIVVDSLDRAVELHKAGAPGTLVTLDGDIVDERGVVSGGSREAQGAGVLAQKREIRELEQIVDSLDRELTEATARLVTAKTEYKQLDRAIEGLRGQAHEGDLAIMGHEKDASRLRSELERLRERAGYLTGERNELEERLAAATREQDALTARKADAENRIDHFEKEQLGLIEGVTGGRERVDEAAAALTEARVRVAQTAEKRASVEAATLRLANTERDLGGRIERLREGIATGSARAAELRADAAALQSELEVHREQRAQHAAEMEAGRAAYDARYTALAQLEIEARELRTQADKLAAEVSQLEVRAASIESARQVVTDSVFEKYQMDVADAVPEYHLRGVCGETEDARASELRELIEKMSGDINLTAIEEYQEVAKRFEFLTGQKADLENAVGQLERAIDKINKTSRRLFKETFASVNATFKEVFPRLFRGGNAHLSLATGKDGEGGEGGKEVDVLEAGVEIFAQPPGKKNTTVDQLSGGEKALTAVALVFSIFLIKPSPFCILDEVDAPLDESNVDRYNEIVREMTDRSQFIVITHNKRTMEQADNLYGVTMQEAGVSKLVTVNLSKLGDRKPEKTAAA